MTNSKHMKLCTHIYNLIYENIYYFIKLTNIMIEYVSLSYFY